MRIVSRHSPGVRAELGAGDPLPPPDDPEAGVLVQAQAGGVLGEDAGLDHPVAGVLGRGDEALEQLSADAVTALVGVDVDGVLHHAPIDLPRRH